MTKLILCSLVLIGFQTAHADEPTLKQQEPAATAPQSEQKSFFESRTLEDFQQMVHVDTKALNEGSADLSSTTAGG